MLGGRNPEAITILVLIVSSIGLDSDENQAETGKYETTSVSATGTDTDSGFR